MNDEVLMVRLVLFVFFLKIGSAGPFLETEHGSCDRRLWSRLAAALLLSTNTCGPSKTSPCSLHSLLLLGAHDRFTLAAPHTSPIYTWDFQTVRGKKSKRGRVEVSRMFRNQYDTDVTTFSPHGRVFQMEYAMEAVKQGTVCVGLCSCTHAVLVTVNKPASELSSYQRKVFRVADHVGVAFSGLTADGRVLIKFLRSECINHAFVYEAPLPVSRLALRLADKEQVRLDFPIWLCF